MINLARYELVLLDADNTLFDYDMAEGIALRKVFEYHNFAYDQNIRDKYREINSYFWREFENGRIDKAGLQKGRFKKLLEELNLDADENEFNSIYLGFLEEGTYLIDGAFEVCRELSEHCTLAIVTNGVARIQKRRLEGSGIYPFIKHIIVSEDAGCQKPNEGFFQYAFNICGKYDKEKVIIVGDSLESDIKGGMDFEIATCWYNPSGIENSSDINSNYEINDLRELLKIIL